MQSDLHGNLPVSMVNLIARRRTDPGAATGRFYGGKRGIGAETTVDRWAGAGAQIRGLSRGASDGCVPSGMEHEGSAVRRRLRVVADAVVRLLSRRLSE